MVGSYVMAEMLHAGIAVVVVVRGKGHQSGVQRIEQILAKFEASWNVTLERPTVLEGDINRPELGLNANDRKIVREQCDRIVHSAASLSFAPADQSEHNEPYRTNVGGTQNVLTFCVEHGVRQFHHVSTAYVCGIRTGIVAENEATEGQEFANDYERSKVSSEEMLHDAVAAGHLQSLTIYRPSIVIDRTGLSPVSGDRTIYGAFSMYQMLASRFGLPAEGEWFRNLGFRGTECKNIVDVDWIARAIRIVVTHPDYHNRTYHLTSAEGTSVQSLDAAFRVTTRDWLQRPSRVTRSKPTKPSKPTRESSPLTGDAKTELDRMAEPFVKTFLPYFRDDPKFDRKEIGRLIAQTELPPTPSIGVNELVQMVRQWTRPWLRSHCRGS